MSKIKTIKDYRALFDGNAVNEIRECSENASKARLALEYALDIRKFEIDMYWKRTTYFWTLITVAFAGYFTVSADSQRSLDAFIIACIGITVSIAWYLVNRGSKYWQENWEMHVDCLEGDWIGPLYKTTKQKENLKFFHVHKGYPFSVSKINQIVSLFAVIVWFVLIMKVVPNQNIKILTWFYEYPRWTVAGATLFGIILIFVLSNGKKSKWERHVDFKRRKLQDE